MKEILKQLIKARPEFLSTVGAIRVSVQEEWDWLWSAVHKSDVSEDCAGKAEERDAD